MRVNIYDPSPFRNEYVSHMFIYPAFQYARDHGISARYIDKPIPENGCVMLCNADYLTPEVITHHRDCECKIVGISCIDSAYLTETLRHEPLSEEVSLIFMVSGVQNTNWSNKTFIDDQLNITAQKVRFLPDEDWARFERMKNAGRIQSLPYVPWSPMPEIPILPFSKRRPKILFRGGNHFWRFLTYLFALRNGVADENSGFQTAAYFDDNMDARFRYCGACRASYKAHGGTFPRAWVVDGENCNSEARQGGKWSLEVPGDWNNRCPQSFYWLAEEFWANHGGRGARISREEFMQSVERALNYKNQSPRDHLMAIGSTTYYAEHKWEFSIHMPQRFWEAASVETLNLLPSRAEDQDYFPDMGSLGDFVTFGDDLSWGLDQSSFEFDEYFFENSARRNRETYAEWIRPTKYRTNTNLLAHIVEQIQKFTS
jgi:hypothetical protein